RYYSAAPDMPPMAPFHLAFTLFRGALMAEGIVARAAQGLAPSGGAAAFARLAPLFARRAREISGG
ncbi:MAG: phosphotransferase family protein, partial [Panacagrimonas sp.]